MRTILLLSIAMSALVPGLLAAQEPTTPPPVAALDPGKLYARTDSFTIRARGEPVGWVRETVERTADGWMLVSDGKTTGVAEERTELRMDERLAMRRVRQTGSYLGVATRVDITYADGRARGTAIVPLMAPDSGAKTVTLDVAVPEHVIHYSAEHALAPALPWAPGATFSLQYFFPNSGELHTKTMTVVGREPVTVPAGTFDAFRVEVTGAWAATTLWVSATAPHRVVRARLTSPDSVPVIELEFVLQ